MTNRFSRTVPCLDTLGRERATDVHLSENGRRVTILPPTPAGSYDSSQLDTLITVLQAARALMPGRP